MIVDEEIDSEGRIAATELFADASGHFLLHRGSEKLPASPQAILAIMHRYGKPLDEPYSPRDSLHIDADCTLHAWAYRPPPELEAKMYLVLEREQHDPIAVIARQVVNALSFLARR